jgi:serine protease Do
MTCDPSTGGTIMTARAFFRRPLVAGIIGAASVALPASALYLYGAAPHAEETSAAAQGVSASRPAAIVSKAPIARGAALPDFSALVEAQGPAVVNISVQAGMRTSARGPAMPGLDPDDPFQQFFRGFPGQGHGGVPMRGEGSGFIVSEDGIILTNAHVVADADKVKVKLKDRREFDAKVLGQDEASDVAVLKIDAANLPTVRLGSPADLKVGEWVVAIGAPFGFDNSVTAGIVSALGRNLPDDAYVPFIQTDVAVNPGNSGGPLFNLAGEVVGINSQIYSRSGGYQGVSFAIPIDVAMNVSRQLQADGHVTRGRLGVGIQDVDDALASTFGLDAPRGALVTSVEPDGPADAAGLKAGDVILSFGKKPVETAGQLPSMVAAAKPGKPVDLEIWRDGASRNVSVQPGTKSTGESVASSDASPESGRLGLMVRPLSTEEQREIDVEDGLVVEGVDGAAAEAGIRRGDVVLSANGKPTHSVEDLRKVVAGAKKNVALLVQRGEARIFVPVQLG